MCISTTIKVEFISRSLSRSDWRRPVQWGVRPGGPSGRRVAECSRDRECASSWALIGRALPWRALPWRALPDRLAWCDEAVTSSACAGGGSLSSAVATSVACWWHANTRTSYVSPSTWNSRKNHRYVNANENGQNSSYKFIILLQLAILMHSSFLMNLSAVWLVLIKRTTF